MNHKPIPLFTKDYCKENYPDMPKQKIKEIVERASALI